MPKAPAAEQSSPESAPESPSDAALARYRASMRRQRTVYAAVLGVIVLALAVVAVVAYEHGEIAHTTSRTVATPPADLAVSRPAPDETAAWRTSDRAALGSPQWAGTVVVYGAHTVRGIDARTGRQTWSYTRSDRTVCAAVQTAGTTVAFFEVHGNCDELTAVQTGTGKRRWTRTLDFDGQPLNGHPSYQVINYTVMVTTPSVIYAIDPGSGYNRWTYSRYGCAIHGAVLGTAGALISQTCTHPRCGTQKYCARGPQLLLRDGVNGGNDSDKVNPDRIHWNLVGTTDVPVSADGVVGALNPTTHALDVYNADKGRPVSTVTLVPVPADADPSTTASLAGPELLWLGGITYLVRPGADRADWAYTSAGPPTAVPLGRQAVLTEPTALITVTTPTGARVLDTLSGRSTATVSLSPAPPHDSLAYPVGTGLLVAAGSGTVLYR